MIGFIGEPRQNDQRSLKRNTYKLNLERTKCPENWILIDKETGEIYQGNPNGFWDRLDPVIKDKFE